MKLDHPPRNPSIATVLRAALIGLFAPLGALLGQDAAEPPAPPEEVPEVAVVVTEAPEVARNQQIDVLSAQALAAEKALNDAAVAVTETEIKLNKAMLAGATDQVASLRAELTTRQGELNGAERQLAEVTAVLKGLTESIQDEMVRSKETIQAGDAIELFVVEDEVYNGVYQVRQGGYVLVPALGRVFVAGLTQGDAERAIAQALAKNQLVNPTVLVERPTNAPIEREGGGFIYLGGQFKEPGAWLIPKNAVPTVVNTVIDNDPTTAADLTRVRLLRLVDGRSTVDEINVRAILRGQGLAEDIQLIPGDIIYVPVEQTQEIVYVTGRVKEPGEIEVPIDETLTAYTAILRAGGFERFANLKKVYVVREAGGGQKSFLPVDIKKVRLGLVPDVELQGKDIVVVPEKFFSL